MSSINIKAPDPSQFVEKVIQRQAPGQTLEKFATELNMRYRRRDELARKAFVDQAVKMFANYENRWLGDVVNGQWRDADPQGTNNVYFTIPLLTAHVDTHTTAYCKVQPKYLAKPYVDTHINRRVADMCQRIGSDELARMLKPSILQHEAQNIALATVSYRNLVMDYLPNSPIISQQQDVQKQMSVPSYHCSDCGSQFQGEPQEEAGEGVAHPNQAQCTDETCMSQNTQLTGVQSAQQTVQQDVQVRLPRAKIVVPSPIAVQDDMSAATFEDSRFVITRRKIAVKEAEFYYKIDLDSAHDSSSFESEAQHREARRPLGEQSGGWVPYTFPEYYDQLEKQVEEVKMWLEPCEYGLVVADGNLLAQQFPTGVHLHIVGDKLVDKRPTNKPDEWIRVQHGVRPLSNKGMGMTHLADLNDGINNAVSLDYAVLRTHGFPLRIIRGKWLSKLPQAAQTLVMEKIPDDRRLDEAVHTEQPANTSGLLGVLTEKFVGFMQMIGGTNNLSGVSPDMKESLGSATGAAVMQEMMSDRMGLPVQMRVEADIETIFAVLNLLKADERNRQYFIDGGYDETVVDEFFRSDLRSLFYLEPVKGTDEPKMDSITTFKVQAFAQLTANLTGLRQFDPRGFYAIVSALGDTLNLDTKIGAGRRERNLADNRVSALIELYKENKDLPDTLQMDAVSFGRSLYQAVTMKDQQWLQSVVATQLQPPPPGSENDKNVQAIMAQQQQYVTEMIQIYMYDYESLVETYADWLQSDAGQNADIAIRTAVGMLYADARGMQEKKKAIDQENAMRAAGMGALLGQKNPVGGEAGVKRDGTTGPGRPHDVHPDPHADEKAA